MTVWGGTSPSCWHSFHRAARGVKLRDMVRENRMKVWPGKPSPRGATWDGKGVNFALFSENATKVELSLFKAPGGNKETARIVASEQTGQVRDVYLPEVRPGSSIATEFMALTSRRKAIGRRGQRPRLCRTGARDTTGHRLYGAHHTALRRRCGAPGSRSHSLATVNQPRTGEGRQKTSDERGKKTEKKATAYRPEAFCLRPSLRKGARGHRAAFVRTASA